MNRKDPFFPDDGKDYALQLDALAPRIVTTLVGLIKHEEVFNAGAGMNAALSDAECLTILFESFVRHPTELMRIEIVRRFLDANHHDVVRTANKLTATAVFRRRQNLHRIALFPSLIPIRGYNERTLCETLNLPYLEEWVDAEANMHEHPLGLDEKGQIRLSYDNDMDFYNHAYKEMFEDTAPTGVFAESKKEPAQEVPCSHMKPETLTAAQYQNPTIINPSKEEAVGPKGVWGHLMGRLTGMALSSPFLHSDTASSHHRQEVQSREVSQTESRHADSQFSESSGTDNASEDIYINTDAVGQTIEDVRFYDYLNFHALLQPIMETAQKHIQMAFHYWDREGHPVMYVSLGHLRAKRLVEDLYHISPASTDPTAVALLAHAYIMEVLTQLIILNGMKKRRDKAIRDALFINAEGASSGTTGTPSSPNPITSAVIIIDAKGVNLRSLFYRPFLKIVKSLWAMIRKHYPSFVHHIYVVNRNPVISIAYLKLRSALGRSTREKITFCKNVHTLDILKDVITTDLLPEPLGGQCSCPGSCVPGPLQDVDGEDGSQRSQIRESLSQVSPTHWAAVRTPSHLAAVPHIRKTVERLVIGASSQQLMFAVVENDEIIWEFAVSKKKSVNYSAVYIPAGDDGGIHSLVAKDKFQEGASHYICPSHGTVILKWSTRSLFQKVQVQVRVFHVSSGYVSD